MEHFLKFQNHLKFSLLIAADLTPLLSLSLRVTNKVQLQELVILILKRQKGTMAVMELALYFESGHPPTIAWLMNDIATKGCHLEGGVVRP